MMSEYVRDASRTCDQAFGFLVQEFGYVRMAPAFEKAGFALRYRGPVVGVIVDWHPREALTVWLVSLVDGDFPARVPITAESTMHYFELADLEAITGTAPPIDKSRLYNLPDQTNAELLADNLRRAAADLLAGDLAPFGPLSDRVKQRVRHMVVSTFGPAEASRRGW
jgi:hypothetical protein